jgi:hypothetical protein
MRHSYFLIFSLLLFAGISACHDCENEGHPDDFIVFGHFYGECGGEGCVEIFKLTGTKLYEDTLDHYPGSNDFYSGEFVTHLSQDKFEAVKDLENFIPDQLYQETDVVIGQPDAGDWGGIYFEISEDGVHRFWLLDQLESNMPAVYNLFVERINEKIALIQG